MHCADHTAKVEGQCDCYCDMKGNAFQNRRSRKTWHNRDEPENSMLSKRRHKRPHCVRFHLCEMSNIGKSIELEGRLVGARDGGKRVRAVTGNGFKGFLWR